jgi:hypothetical protein
MTGRFSIRSGTHSVPIGGLDGLTQWEVTIAELLSGVGYSTGHFGKWHLGSDDGRLPNDQGFDEWYGIPRTTDETTFAQIAGASLPQGRAIDGVDQSDFLLGTSDTSNREGFPVFVADRLEAVKWRNWKVVFYDEQRDWWTSPLKLGVPKAFDLITDPKEEYPQTALRNSWNAGPATKIVVEFVSRPPGSFNWAVAYCWLTAPPKNPTMQIPTNILCPRTLCVN